MGLGLLTFKLDLKLTKLKSIPVEWLVEFYNQTNTSKREEIINNGWKAADISDALQLGLSKIPLIDPFYDIDLMLCDGNEQPDDCHLLLHKNEVFH